MVFMSLLCRFSPVRFRESKHGLLFVIDIGAHFLRFVAVEKFDHAAIAFVKRQYVLPWRSESHEIASERVISKIREGIFHAAKKYEKIPERVIIGFSAHLAFNIVVTHREKFDKKQAVTAAVISRITSEVAAKQKIFTRNINGSRREYVLMRVSPIRISVDGYEVLTLMPSIMQGMILELTLLFTYAEKNFFAGCEGIQKMLGGIPITCTATHVAVTEILVQKKTLRHFLLIKIGGDATEVSLIRDGSLQWSETVSMGGDNVTEAIAIKLGISRSRAEEMKCQYGRLQLSSSIAEHIRAALNNENNLFIKELRTVLFEKQSLLPPRIFIYGGGGKTPLLTDALQDSGWREDISFTETVDIHLLNAADIAGPALQSNFLRGPEDVGLASLAATLLHAKKL